MTWWLAFGIGLIIGVGLGYALASGRFRLVRAQDHERNQQLASESAQLRREAAEDKETIRLLRHESASLTPDRLVETAMAAERERDLARAEADGARSELEQISGRLADRESKLREYREALREIRLALEAQGAGALLGSAPRPATEEVASDRATLLEEIEPVAAFAGPIDHPDPVGAIDHPDPVGAIDHPDPVGAIDHPDSGPLSDRGQTNEPE